MAIPMYTVRYVIYTDDGAHAARLGGLTPARLYIPLPYCCYVQYCTGLSAASGFGVDYLQDNFCTISLSTT